MKITGRLKFVMLISVLAAFFFCGCTAAMRAKMTVNSMQPLMDKMRVAVNKNSDVDLVADAMPVSLVQMDGFIETSPDNMELLVRAAEANTGYAFLFLEDTNRARAASLHKKARGYALRALQHNKAFQNAITDGTTEEVADSLEMFDKEDVPALYFAVISWLSYINLASADNPNLVADLPKVELMMDRVLFLDDTFNHGGIHATLGAYLASRPEQLGGQLQEAKYHFEEAFDISESKFLIWQFLYAKTYAVQIQDRSLFVKTLEDIIAAPENLLPEENFANEAIKRRAKALLAQVDNIF